MDLLIKMSLKLYIICTAAVFSLMSLASAGSTATIHGAVYKWDTFESLDNAVIEINSTPTQYMVAKNGQYSIELAPGNYTITARYYQNSILSYSTEEAIEIKDGEDYVLDLLLLPVNSEGLIDGSKVNVFSENLNESAKSLSKNAKNPIKVAAIDKINNSNGVDITKLRAPSTKQSRFYFSVSYYLLMVLISFFLSVGGYLLFRKHKQIKKDVSQEEKTGSMTGNSGLDNMPELLVKVFAKGAESRKEYPAKKIELEELGSEEENIIISFKEPAQNPSIETPALKKKLRSSADFKEVMDAIRSQGGQISQKDLRSRLKCSEAKVSLLLADLEKKKMIEKFKRGRENVVVLMDDKR